LQPLKNSPHRRTCSTSTNVRTALKHYDAATIEELFG
jgi:hypothetical protein